MCSSWTKVCASSHLISAIRLYTYQVCNDKMTARCRGALDNRASCSPMSTRQYGVPPPPHHWFHLLNWTCTPSSCQSIPTSSPAVCQKQTCKVPTCHPAWTRFDLVPASLTCEGSARIAHTLARGIKLAWQGQQHRIATGCIHPDSNPRRRHTCRCRACRIRCGQGRSRSCSERHARQGPRGPRVHDHRKCNPTWSNPPGSQRWSGRVCICLGRRTCRIRCGQACCHPGPRGEWQRARPWLWRPGRR